jgi:hypothetical protein
MLASTPSQHLESDFEPSRNPKCESTSINHALVIVPPCLNPPSESAIAIQFCTRAEVTRPELAKRPAALHDAKTLRFCNTRCDARDDNADRQHELENHCFAHACSEL